MNFSFLMIDLCSVIEHSEYPQIELQGQSFVVTLPTGGQIRLSLHSAGYSR